ELQKVVRRAKQNKAPGFDEIPADVLKNDTACSFLLKLFNICFLVGKVPNEWSKCVLNPIPKSSSLDKNDPLSYRGIALAPASYKLFCALINNRLTKWAENNNILADEQNGFRSGRSTIDHISTLTNIIETRKLKRKQTFAAFIDFKKAYDSVNRTLLWSKLEDIGIAGNILNVIKVIYNDVQYCIRLNGLHTDWFSVKTGLKQGCLLSPILFNIFINNLVDAIKSLNVGIDIDGEMVGILLYADDLVLVADNETDLQLMLNTLSIWCTNNKISVNSEKSKIVHFRTPSVNKSQSVFKCGDLILDIAPQYNYLGLTLTEFLNYDTMASNVAKSASRALGLVIHKSKLNGGFPFKCFTKLYDSLVWPIMDYGSSIWGTSKRSCIESVQNRACRYFMSVGKYTPNIAVQGDMGWIPTSVKIWKAIGRTWARFNDMDETRLNKRIFNWCVRQSENRCKNWFYKFREHMTSLNLGFLLDNNVTYSKRYILNLIHDKEFAVFQQRWSNELNNVNRANGSQSKLRSYKLFKTEYKSEEYLLADLPVHHRSALAKFRCGVAPIRIETGRYERLPIESRLCTSCNTIESEIHVICECPLYDDLRNSLFDQAKRVIPGFNSLSNEDKMCAVLSNYEIVKITAKILYDILHRKRSYTFR
ncbi:MAG: reverse transcriptase family protein, partial [Candidatus Thiodiazotropha taylori]|nr:reverse transcriptase family protein [Candidatus Thiodiazotropha taylori]MCW4335238.1 reverse transcriptase family protein [Candidatus Thiodiazotropha endolucinida]